MFSDGRRGSTHACGISTHRSSQVQHVPCKRLAFELGLSVEISFSGTCPLREEGGRRCTNGEVEQKEQKEQKDGGGGGGRGERERGRGT